MANENLNVAVQATNQPTNKVAATGTAAGGLAAVIAGTMAAYGGPAIQELLGSWGTNYPSVSQLLILIVTGVAAYFATKYGSQQAAWNVLDKPNIPLVPAETVVVKEVVVEEPKVGIEENIPE